MRAQKKSTERKFWPKIFNRKFLIEKEPGRTRQYKLVDEKNHSTVRVWDGQIGYAKKLVRTPRTSCTRLYALYAVWNFGLYRFLTESAKYILNQISTSRSPLNFKSRSPLKMNLKAYWYNFEPSQWVISTISYEPYVF